MPRIHYMRHQIGGEDAVTFYDPQNRPDLIAVEHDVSPDRNSDPIIHLIAVEPRPSARTGIDITLDSDQTAELARFCTSQFCDPAEKLDTIEAACASVKSALEDWNNRARADEEHPPYDDLVRRLDEIQGALARLEWLRRKR